MIDVLAITGICLGALALLVVMPAYRRERRWRLAAQGNVARLTGKWSLERLLAVHPHAEVAWVENQREEVVEARRQQSAPFERVNTQPGPWTCVDLYENGKILRFAIWNRTDTVYALDEAGAVGEEPYL